MIDDLIVIPQCVETTKRELWFAQVVGSFRLNNDEKGGSAAESGGALSAASITFDEDFFTESCSLEEREEARKTVEMTDSAGQMGQYTIQMYGHPKGKAGMVIRVQTTTMQESLNLLLPELTMMPSFVAESKRVAFYEELRASLRFVDGGEEDCLSSVYDLGED